RLSLDEARRLRQVEKPLVPVGRRIGRQAVMADRTLAPLNRPTGVGPIVRQRNDDMAAADPNQFGEGMVEVVEVFQYVRANHSVESAVLERQPVDLLEVDRQV